jgi:hypothetical protein
VLGRARVGPCGISKSTAVRQVAGLSQLPVSDARELSVLAGRMQPAAWYTVRKHVFRLAPASP